MLSQALEAVVRAEAWSLVLICILLATLLIIGVLIFRHPQNPTKASFMVRAF